MLNNTLTPRISAFSVSTTGYKGCSIIIKVGSGVANFNIRDRAGIKPIWNTYSTYNSYLEDKETYYSKKLNTGLIVARTF